MAFIDHTNNNIQQELRDVSIGAWGLQENVYANGLIPSKSSKLSHGTYWKYDPRYFMSTQVQSRAVGSMPPVAKYEATTATYTIGQKHLSVAVTNEEIVEASDSLAPLRDAALFLNNNFIVDYQLDFADSFVTDNVWQKQAEGKAAVHAGIEGDPLLAIGAVGAGEFEQFNRATSDPLKVLLQAIRSIHLDTGLRPNKLLIPRLVFDALRDNPNVVVWASNTIGLNGGDEQTKSILSMQLGIPVANIKVVEFVYQDITSVATANRDVQNFNFGEALTPTFGSMKWAIDKACLLMHTTDSFSKYSKTSAVCMKWDGLMAMQSGSDPALGSSPIDSGNLFIRSRFEKNNFTHYVDGYFAYANYIVSPNLGYYLKNCIA